MKKITLFLMMAMICPSSIFATSQLVRVPLAEWTFDWCSPTVASGTSKIIPVASDRGKQIATALLATENITGTGRGFSWPTSTGYYVYSTNWNTTTPEKYWWVYGLNTIGCTDLQVYSKHSNSTGYSSAFKIQYRLGGVGGTWTDFYGPFDVTKTVTLNNPLSVGDGPTPKNPAILPKECEEQSSLEIRYLLTTPQSSGSGQVRIDSVVVSAMMLETTTLLNKNETNNVKVVSANNKIKIFGAEGLNAIIYTVSGIKVGELKSLTNEQEIIVPDKSVYIVKVNNKAFKVHL